MFTVCSKSQVHFLVKEINATHLITMLDPDDHIYKPNSILIEDHLFLKFEDEEDENHPRSPTIDHCRRILDFGKALPDDAITVVHCFAGMCRSTAAALALHVQRYGNLNAARSWLAQDRPQAMPNMLMAQHFDKLLGMNGKFLQLCNEINKHRLIVIHGSTSIFSEDL
jgi:predicted protein tyrosine phosphatase